MSTIAGESGADAASIRKVVNVQAPPEVAWRVFTAQMGAWWPLMSHEIGAARLRAVSSRVPAAAGTSW